MWIDEQSSHVARLTYVPKQLPPHATSGSITEVGGQAMHDLWYVVRIDERFQGHHLFLSGDGTFAGTFDQFARYASIDEGLAALDRGGA